MPSFKLGEWKVVNTPGQTVRDAVVPHQHGAQETTAIALSVVSAEVNADAVDLLEGLLARVRSGECMDVAIVEVTRRRSVATAWSKGGSYHLLNSGASRLAARLACLES